MCKITSDYKARRLYDIERRKAELKAELEALTELEKKYSDEIKAGCDPVKGKPVKDTYKDMTITVSAVSGSRRCNYNKLLKLSSEIYNQVVTVGAPTKAIRFTFQ